MLKKVGEGDGPKPQPQVETTPTPQFNSSTVTVRKNSSSSLSSNSSCGFKELKTGKVEGNILLRQKSYIRAVNESNKKGRNEHTQDNARTRKLYLDNNLITLLTSQWKREISTLEAEQVLKVDSNQDCTAVNQKPVATSRRPNFNIDKSTFVNKTPSRMLNPKILSWCSIGTEYINSINNEDYDEKCLQVAKYTKLFAKSVAATDSHRIVEAAIQGLNFANTEINETSKSVSDAIMKAETDFKETTILRRFVKYESDYHSSIDDFIEYIKEDLVAIENGMGRFYGF